TPGTWRARPRTGAGRTHSRASRGRTCRADRKRQGSRDSGRKKIARSSFMIRVAIIGVGNCASSLVQGVEFYKDACEEEMVPGLMHVSLGGYHVRDIEFSAAFDINTTKVGR